MSRKIDENQHSNTWSMRTLLFESDALQDAGKRDREEKMMNTYSIFDIASWFLSKESMTHKKLQKLCYYTQAWGLALYGRRIISSSFEAWVHGPVCPELFQKYKDYGWQAIPRNTCSVTFDAESQDVLDNVWYRYGDLDGDQLESITHEELPWSEKRAGLLPHEPGYRIISEDTMRTFYLQQMANEQENC